MLKDVMIIDDALEDPHSLIQYAKEQKFLGPDLHDKWVGERSRDLFWLDKPRITPVVNSLVGKLFEDMYADYRVTYNWTMFAAYFHRMNVGYQDGRKWKHVDGCGGVIAGVVYLNENAPPSSGTVIIGDKSEFLVENRFNRLVLYKGNIPHYANHGFGLNKDARLTLTLFFSSINISAST